VDRADRIDVIDPEQSLFSPENHVGIELADGQVAAGPRIRFALGRRNPVSQSKPRVQFEECTRGRLDNAQRTHRFSMLADLKSLRSISELCEHAPLPLVIRYYLLTY
jgi:hypothetical protein